jgi:hypothetical protein
MFATAAAAQTAAGKYDPRAASIIEPYAGTTPFTYKIRTGAATTGTITLLVTSDFNGAEPKVATLTNGDALTYTCSATAASGSACGSAQTASTSTPTPVVSFGANAHSTKAGDAGSVSWSLTNDPAYAVGDFTATVTFTISAT